MKPWAPGVTGIVPSRRVARQGRQITPPASGDRSTPVPGATVLPQAAHDSRHGSKPIITSRRSVATRRASLAVSVNRRYARFDTILQEGDDVVFIPPVSGG